MNMKGILFCCFVIGYGIAMSSCDGKRSLSNEKKYDSLFLGMYLGMEKKAFFDHCWELNRLKVFTNGPKSASIEYKLAKDLAQPVMMRFYPSFHNEKIFEMPVTFSYEAWAPWNKQYSSAILFDNMVPVFKKWYGEDFKVIEHPTMGTIYVKMDGKRRINLFIRDDQFVQAVFTDLKIEREIKNQERKDSIN